MKALVASLAVLCFYGFFYRTVVKRAGSLVSSAVARLELHARRSAREVEAVEKLTAAAVAQLLFALALMAMLRISPGGIVGLRPDLLVLGCLLGVGELALAGFLCTVALEIASFASYNLVTDDWLRQARSGWMRYFAATRSAAPAWLGATIISLYVIVEELVFRGILISATAPYGAVIACAVSTTLFVVTQVFGMPSARSAFFPVIGAAVVGPIHAILFWHVPDLLPLVIAHLAFFWGALRFTTPRLPAAAPASLR